MQKNIIVFTDGSCTGNGYSDAKGGIGDIDHIIAVGVEVSAKRGSGVFE